MRITNHKEFLSNAFFLNIAYIQSDTSQGFIFICIPSHSLISMSCWDILISQVPIAVCIQHLPGTEQDAQGSLRIHPFQTPSPELAHLGLRMLRGL